MKNHLLLIGLCLLIATTSVTSRKVRLNSLPRPEILISLDTQASSFNEYRFPTLTAIPATFVDESITLAIPPTKISQPGIPSAVPLSVPSTSISIVIQTRTVYVYDSQTITTYGTIFIPAEPKPTPVAEQISESFSVPSFFPSSVPVPASYVIIPITQAKSIVESLSCSTIQVAAPVAPPTAAYQTVVQQYSPAYITPVQNFQPVFTVPTFIPSTVSVPSSFVIIAVTQAQTLISEISCSTPSIAVPQEPSFSPAYVTVVNTFTPVIEFGSPAFVTAVSTFTPVIEFGSPAFVTAVSTFTPVIELGSPAFVTAVSTFTPAYESLNQVEQVISTYTVVFQTISLPYVETYTFPMEQQIPSIINQQTMIFTSITQEISVPTFIPESVTVPSTFVIVPVTQAQSLICTSFALEPPSAPTFVSAPSVTIYIPSTIYSPVAVPISWVSNVPSSVYVTISLVPSVVVISYSAVPSTVPSAVIVTIPYSNIVVVPSSSFVEVPATVVVPTTWESPVVIPIAYASTIPRSEIITIASSPSAIIVPYTYVPDSVPFSVIASIPSTAVVSVPQSSFVTVPSVVTVPSNWVSPVAVPISWVSSLPSDEVVVTASSPSVAIVQWENVPASVPTYLVASIPSSIINTVSVTEYVFVPATVAVPSSWNQPVVVPISYVANYPSSKIITIVSSPNAAIVDFKYVPRNVPFTEIAVVPSTAIVNVPLSSIVEVPSTVSVPSVWVSPVVLPASYVQNIPASEVIILSSQPSVAVVSYENVPSTVPTYVVVSLPYSVIDTFSVPTVPTLITVPNSWVSPVVVPVSEVSTLPFTEVVTIPSSPSVVIVEITNVPSTVPSFDIVTVPSSNIQTYIHVPATVAVPSTWESPVVIPVSWASSIPESQFVTVFGSPSIVIISWENIPASIPFNAVETIPSTAIVSVPASQFSSWVVVTEVILVPTVITVPSTWESPVVVPVSWVSELSYSEVVTISSQTDVVIVSYSVVPDYVPSTVIIPVPSQSGVVTVVPSVVITFVPSFVASQGCANVIETIPVTVQISTWVSVPYSIAVPSTWESPIIVPVTEVWSLPTTQVVVVASNPTEAIIQWSWLPSTVPVGDIATVPSSVVVYVPPTSFVSVPSTVVVPATWVSPVAVPVSWVENVPQSDYIVLVNSPSVAIISYEFVPSSVPQGIIETIPSTHIIQVPTSTVYVPTYWTSPVVVPAAWVSTISSYNIITIPSAPHQIIVSFENVPSFVPSTVIASIPSTMFVQWEPTENFDVWVPTYIPTTISQTLVDHCYDLVPSSALVPSPSPPVQTVPEFVPKTFPPVFTLTWVPTKVPTVITSTLVEHCVDILPSTKLPPFQEYVPPTVQYITPIQTVTPIYTLFTWAPHEVPQTITPTLVQHCIDVLPPTMVPKTAYITFVPTWSPSSQFTFEYIPPPIEYLPPTQAFTVPPVLPPTLPPTLIQHCVDYLPSTELVNVPPSYFVTVYNSPPVPENVWTPATEWVPEFVPEFVPSTIFVTITQSIYVPEYIPSTVVATIPSPIHVPQTITAPWIPSTIPTTIPQTLINHCINVISPQLDTIPPVLTYTVIVPSTWTSPVVVPITLIPSVPLNLVITIPSSPSIVIIQYENVPPTVPSIFIVSIPSTFVETITVPTISVTVPVPSTWSTPVMVPITYIPSTVPSTDIITIPYNTVVVIEYSRVPSTIPSIAVISVPPIFIQTVAVPSIEYRIEVPSTIYTPVIISIEAIPSTVPSWVYVTVPGSPSLVIISYNNVPRTVPSAVIVTIPSSKVITYVQTIYVPPSITATWVPSTIPTTIPQTLIQHCIDKIPTPVYVTPYTEPSVSPSVYTFLPSTVTIPSSFILIPATQLQSHCNAPTIKTPVYITPVYITPVQTFSPIPQSFTPSPELIQHCANYLPTTVVSPALPTRPPQSLVEKCRDYIPQTPVQEVHEQLPKADFQQYYTFANKKSESVVQPVQVLAQTPQNCQGWWVDENVDLADTSSDVVAWYLDNCSIEDPTTHVMVEAKMINFSTDKGKQLMYSNWVCKSGDATWTFDFGTCEWSSSQGQKTLIEVREQHNVNVAKSQAFLGM